MLKGNKFSLLQWLPNLLGKIRLYVYLTQLINSPVFTLFSLKTFWMANVINIFTEPQKVEMKYPYNKYKFGFGKTLKENGSISAFLEIN